jgi:WD40 repeat protein
VWDVAFSPDGRFLASASGRWQNYRSGGGPGEVRLWEINCGESIQTHETPFCLYSVAFSGDGRRFAASGGVYHPGFRSKKRGEIRVWDAGSGDEVFSATRLSSCVYSVALSPDGEFLVAAVGPNGESGPFDVKLWDLEIGREILTLGQHEKKVYGVAFSPDGKRIASAGMEGVVKIWNVE